MLCSQCPFFLLELITPAVRNFTSKKGTEKFPQNKKSATQLFYLISHVINVHPHILVLIIDIQAVEEQTGLQRNELLQKTQKMIYDKEISKKSTNS